VEGVRGHTPFTQSYVRTHSNVLSRPRTGLVATITSLIYDPIYLIHENVRGTVPAPADPRDSISLS
jgi:hypothetical protein